MKLSIITINLNNKSGLRKTVQSVVNQNTMEFEYIVIDGNSSDGSQEVLEEFSDKIDICISEKDSGIYNAMNKGVKYAHGDYCLFLNSGDTLIDENVVKRVLSHLNGEYGILTGYTLLVDGKGSKKRDFTASPKEFSSILLIKSSLSHPSSFIQRSLLLNFPYDENYKIVSDWKFFCEMLLFGKSNYKHLDFDISLFQLDGISSQNHEKVYLERESYLNTIIPERLKQDLSALDPELIPIYKDFRYNFKIKKYIINHLKLLRRLKATFLKKR